MGALNPKMLVGIEDRITVLAEEGAAFRSRNLWWPKVATERTSKSRREFLTWFINSVVIRDLGKSAGNLSYSDLEAVYQEIENGFAGEGFEISKADLEDQDGGGLNAAATWARAIGAYMAYWPQKQVAFALKNGHDAATYPGLMGYDGKALFALDHPIHPKKPGVGTFRNIFTGSADGAYPGACPVHGTGSGAVSLDVALENLGKIQAYIASIKMPNGEDPRGLRGVRFLAGPRLFPRLAQLTNAKFLAQAASSGGGSADVEAYINALGYGQPEQVDELAGYEDDTTFFVVAEGIAPTELGPIVYQTREPFRIDNYGPLTDHQLGRMQKFDWQVHGRNTVAAGHPFLIFKVKAS